MTRTGTRPHGSRKSIETRLIDERISAAGVFLMIEGCTCGLDISAPGEHLHRQGGYRDRHIAPELSEFIVNPRPNERRHLAVMYPSRSKPRSVVARTFCEVEAMLRLSSVIRMLPRESMATMGKDHLSSTCASTSSTEVQISGGKSPKPWTDKEWLRSGDLVSSKVPSCELSRLLLVSRYATDAASEGFR